MDIRKALIPYHFGVPWDIIPNRIEDDWELVGAQILSNRLAYISNRKFDLVVSGDCMAAIGAHRDGLPLVWMDAHGDFNTLKTTRTGNIGGMPLAMLCGVGDRSLVECCNRRQIAQEVYHLGGSEFDPGETSRMWMAGIRFSLPHPLPDRIHLHIDTDVIREKEMPSSIHPAPNGMYLQDFYMVLNDLLPQTEVLSIKSYDPRLDISGAGEVIVLEIIRRFHESRTN